MNWESQSGTQVNYLSISSTVKMTFLKSVDEPHESETQNHENFDMFIFLVPNVQVPSKINLVIEIITFSEKLEIMASLQTLTESTLEALMERIRLLSKAISSLFFPKSKLPPSSLVLTTMLRQSGNQIHMMFDNSYCKR